MKRHFPLFYTDSKSDKTIAIKEGYIFLDTNVLLHFFRLGESFSNTFFQILEKVKDRVFIPYQVAKEYHPKYIELCVSLKQTYRNALNHLPQLIDPLSQLGEKKMDYIRFLDKGIKDVCNSQFTKLIATIESKYKKEIEFLSKELDDSALFQKIADTFCDKVLEPLENDVLKETCKQGKERYEKKIPPGYKDAKKGENAFGDLIIWNEIINCVASKDEVKYAILVSDDMKEDWVLEISGEKHGARRELIEEFDQKAHARFICMSVSTFIDAVQENYNVVDKKEADEAKDASTGFQKARRTLTGIMGEKLSLQNAGSKIRYSISNNEITENNNELHDKSTDQD